MTDLLVLHDLGAEGGVPWAEAFAGWEGDVVAPDLPGHGDAPLPVGGHQELGDAVFLLDALPRADDPPVVVGVGRNGVAAQTLALGGRAAALVLVDGLGGPWLDVDARARALREHRRRILTTPAALAPHRAGTPDPRVGLIPPAANRDFAVRCLRELPCPVLAVETAASETPDAPALIAEAAHGTLVLLGSVDDGPGGVAAVVRDWWVTTRSSVPG